MNIDGSLARLNDFFNLTATYKHGTDFDDIYSGEGVVWKHNAGFDRDFDFHGQKNRGVQSVRNLGDFVFCTPKPEMNNGSVDHVFLIILHKFM